MRNPDISDAEQYVREHKSVLRKIIQHGDDQFVRALCLTALVRYGDAPDIEELREELDRAAEEMGEG